MWEKIILIFLLSIIQLSRADILDLSLPEADLDHDPSTTEPLTLSRALSRAQAENLDLAKMRAHANAMAAIPPQAASLADPMINISALNLPVDTFNRDQEAMTQLQLGISQQIPYPGKLALKEKIAAQLANAANSHVDEMRLQLNRNVKTGWWHLFFIDRSIEVVEINQTLLRQFIEIAQTKYKVGQGLQQDVLLAQLELSKLIDSKLQLSSDRQQQVAYLNVLLNQPAETAIALPSLTDIATGLPNILPTASLVKLAQDKRPALAEKKLLIAAANARYQLAKRNLLPDFNVGASYGFRHGNNLSGDQRADVLSVNIGITMPLYAASKQKMAITQRSIEVQEQHYAFHEHWLAVETDIVATVADYNKARQQVSLFNTGIIPQAQQTVSSMLAAYQVNNVDFLNLIRAQITLYNYQTNLWQTISQGQSALAKLVATVGEEKIYE